MTNEILLVASIVLIYGGVIVFYKFFGKSGLFAFSILATVLANIEVLLVVDAFKMEMTLGNVLFASTFLITDILSENHDGKTAKKAVAMSTTASIFFIILSQMWINFVPSESDWAMGAFQTIFANTPRMILASLSVYLISQLLDVWLYHRWWDFTTKRFGDSRRGLWVRNNGSTLISQMANTCLFTLFAFYGMYDFDTMISIMVSSYVIFIVTSLLDTPMVYLARRIHEAAPEDK
ncbi:MAG: queuosine precursor transporter [Eubacterium sp.]|nr:queuosine precursor transporter [Candidatus Colimonas fimequi]